MDGPLVLVGGGARRSPAHRNFFTLSLIRPFHPPTPPPSPPPRSDDDPKRGRLALPLQPPREQGGGGPLYGPFYWRRTSIIDCFCRRGHKGEGEEGGSDRGIDGQALPLLMPLPTWVCALTRGAEGANKEGEGGK